MRNYLYGATGAANGAVFSRATKMEAASLSPSKRRKVDTHSQRSQENSVSVSSSGSVSSAAVPATSFRLNGILKKRSPPSDLNTQAEGFEANFSTLSGGALSRETSQLSNLSGDSQEVDSSAERKKKTSTAAVNSIRKPSTGKTPLAEEIEEFFCEAEKYQQKRFAEKYNYDIVKDVAMEGRYEWGFV